MTERRRTLYALWAEVNRIATTTEDSKLIRNLIAEARIEPNAHVGTPQEAFTPEMVAEWALGQWASMIDDDSPWMNTIRNISLAQYDRAVDAFGMAS